VAEAPNDLGALQLLWITQTRLGLTERAATTRARREKVQKNAKSMDQLIEQLHANPDDPTTRWKMGQVAVDAGSLLLAERCFEAALTVDPGYGPARESLAALRASHPELTRDRSPPAHLQVSRPLSRTPSAKGATPESPVSHR